MTAPTFGAGRPVSDRARLAGHEDAETRWAPAYAELRRLGSTLAVVFLSGHGDVPMAVEQMKSGAVDFLQNRSPLNR